jgi:hypothetical protein
MRIWQYALLTCRDWTFRVQASSSSSIVAEGDVLTQLPTKRFVIAAASADTSGMTAGLRIIPVKLA